MNSLALINEFLGQPPNASEHGYPDRSHHRVLPLVHGRALCRLVDLFHFRADSLPERAVIRVADHQGVRSGISTHLEFSVVLIEAVLLLGFAIPLWAKTRESISDRQRRDPRSRRRRSSLTGTITCPDRMGSLAGAMSVLSATRIRSASIRMIPLARTTSLSPGELHVPVDRPVLLELSSKDVIHNFVLPDMRIAQDAIPGSLIPMWFTPIKTGLTK